MVQLTLRIDGMSCGMCESHVNDTIRQKFNVKKVTSSHKITVFRGIPKFLQLVF